LPTVASNFESGTEERIGSELVCDFALGRSVLVCRLKLTCVS
jgi:hypothetical protein